MVDDTGGAQTFHAGGIDGCRGGIGAEGIGGVDVVVDVLIHHGRELGCFHHFAKVGQTLILGGGIQQVENVDIDHNG